NTWSGRSSPGASGGKEPIMSQPTLLGPQQFLARKSFVELNARERAQALLDEGSYRELLGPFERLESPWLLMQGVVPQADDGLIVARGKVGGTDSVILAIEGQFQGGGIGEVSGAKFSATLALKEARKVILCKVFCFWGPRVFVCKRRILVWKPLPKSTRRLSPCGSMF